MTKHPRISYAALGAAGLLALSVYLFVDAPPALPEQGLTGEQAVPVEQALELLSQESASIRTLYTKEIVGPGLKQGLEFSEDWREAGVQAGPLPALMLREISNRLQIREPNLSLFLGSDFPIVGANLFKGEQAGHYTAVKTSRQPRFFYDQSQGRSTAMFPDVASAQACVTCHNEHPKSPKKDWALNDVMGATTWSYRGRHVSPGEMLRMLQQLRLSAYDAYGAYLKKVEGFDAGARPQLGPRWPRDGRYLPDVETFRREVEAQNSAQSLTQLFEAMARPKAKQP